MLKRNPNYQYWISICRSPHLIIYIKLVTFRYYFRFFISAIANNILQCINKSKHIILVLSPAYVNSDYTRMEWQVAQHRMVSKKIRVIPILFEDISCVKTAIDATLKNIIESITYIEYQGIMNVKQMELFWKKLHSALSISQHWKTYNYVVPGQEKLRIILIAR